MEDEGKAGAAPRTLVVFADGTGNAFNSRATNVWRLYCVLDKQGSGQIARYIPGVGTNSNRILRALDGATGFGVPQNVRKLYRFLCWNWRDGDRIVLIGFSRGAFTVRTLAALIARQGLMPSRRPDGRPVTNGEMRRNTLGAWRAFRAAGTTYAWPTVRIARWLRDRCIDAKRRAMEQDLHPTVARAVQDSPRAPVAPLGQDTPQETPPRRGVTIAFMGVFDTVEAFGVPVDELRWLIGRLIYPLSFANRFCALSVTTARQALALDEARKTFDAVQFERPLNDWQDIRECWFPGVHSDVGGGYPDDHLSIPPLLWMAEESGLKFQPGALDDFTAGRFDRAPVHDSRGGFSSAYRYQPRRPAKGAKAHEVVGAKIGDSADPYAPITLRDPIAVPGRGDRVALPPATVAELDRMIFQRRFLNRVLILTLVFFVLSPLIFPPVNLIEEVGAGWTSWWGMGLLRSGWWGLAVLSIALTAWVKGRGVEAAIQDYAVSGWHDAVESPPTQSPRPRRRHRRFDRLEAAFLICGAVLVGLALWRIIGGLIGTN